LYGASRQAELALGESSGFFIKYLVGPRSKTPQSPAGITRAYLNLQATSPNPERNKL
jgi:hypothetical protein